MIKSQPKPGCVEEYNDWYDSEYGPLLQKLDAVRNAYQYRSTENPSIYLATYDLKKISSFEEPRYHILGEKRSPQEQELIDHNVNLLDRRVYAEISTRGHVEGPAPIMMSVAFVVKDEHVDEMHRWYEEEHTSDLMQIPGWLRSRRFQLVDSDDQKPGYTELLAVHEYAKENGLDGKEHELAKSKPWRNRILALVESRKNQRYEFLHEFNAGNYKKPSELVSGQAIDGVSPSMTNGISKTFTCGTPLLAN